MTTDVDDMSWLPDVGDEIWLPVTNFEGLYEVSRFERVRSLDRFIEKNNRWGYRSKFRQPGIELSPYTTAKGRRQVVLHDSTGRRHSRSVRRLAAEAFGEAAA
jgi:hypothetical protein